MICFWSGHLTFEFSESETILHAREIDDRDMATIVD